MADYTIKVNGILYEPKENELDMSLLTWLRESAGLTGAKCGCGVGQCGTCNVLIDGKAKRSCLVKVGRLQNQEIITIESLAVNGKLHPVQESFLKCGVMQCGYCTPSQIITVVGLLNENPDPTREDINKAFKGVYCRCGTYPRVLNAIKRAAAVMRGDRWEDTEEYEHEGVLGKSFLMPDAEAKVTGKIKFVDDNYFDNCLYGKIVWSEYPHAKLIDVDAVEASRMDGISLVLSYKNVPEYIWGPLVRDTQLIARYRVKYIGDPVAVVFADTQAQADSAAAKIRVVYEELEPVLTPQRALEPDAPLVHEQGNVTKELVITKGNVDEAFDQADVILEHDYYVPRIEHAWMETESSIAKPNDAGGVDVYTVTQAPFDDRESLAEFLELDQSKIRVIQVPCGGSFGGKGELPLPMFTALAALRTGRPAKITLTRKESLRYHPKRHPFNMSYRLAAKKTGEISGMDINLLADGGAYTSYSFRVIPQAVSYSTGPYYVPNLRVKGKIMFTNNITSGAMRGYGAPQVLFAAESMMDELARKINMDPIELRKKNAVKNGTEVATGQILGPGQAYDKTLDVIKEKIRTELLPLKEKDKNIGIGIASGWRHISGGLDAREQTNAALELKDDGRLLLKVCLAEMGNESQVGLSQIVSYVLDVPYDLIDISPMETDKVPWGAAVMASRGIFLWGQAVIPACDSLKGVMKKEVACLTGVNQDKIEFSKGMFTYRETNEVLCNLKELAEYAKSKKIRIEAEGNVLLPQTYFPLEDGNRGGTIPVDRYITHHANSYITVALALKVDKINRKVDVLKVISALDIGTVINTGAAKRQVEGGIIMGMGAAVIEEFAVEGGWNKADTLSKYKMLDISAIPDIEVIFVDNYVPNGPLGAKGIGEIGVLPMSSAIVNAFCDATGERLFRIPVLKNM